ncbi:MAG: integrase core domain-containing protein [Aureliella sp.]
MLLISHTLKLTSQGSPPQNAAHQAWQMLANQHNTTLKKDFGTPKPISHIRAVAYWINKAVGCGILAPLSAKPTQIPKDSFYPHRVVHFNVTSNPTARWTAQQIVNAFPYEDTPRFLLRDRDGIYGEYFQERMKSMQIDEVPTAPRSPWQNPYAERIIGSIRRECLNHLIVLNQVHLKRVG